VGGGWGGGTCDFLSDATSCSAAARRTCKRVLRVFVGNAVRSGTKLAVRSTDMQKARTWTLGDVTSENSSRDTEESACMVARRR